MGMKDETFYWVFDEKHKRWILAYFLIDCWQSFIGETRDEDYFRHVIPIEEPSHDPTTAPTINDQNLGTST